MAGISPDQLRGNAHSTARFTHATLDDIARAELLSDFLDVDSLALIGKGRVACDHRKGAPAGEHRDDVLGDAVGKELLLQIAAEVDERQDCDGATIVEPRQAHRRYDAPISERRRLLRNLIVELKDADRLGDIFEAMPAEILEIEPHLTRDAIADDLRDVDAAWFGQRLEPRGNINAVAKDIATLSDDVVEIDPD